MRTKNAATPATEKDLQLLIESEKKTYQSMVGCLQYLVNGTRPDIAFATMQAARRNSAPNHQNMVAANRIFRYLKATRRRTKTRLKMVLLTSRTVAELGLAPAIDMLQVTLSS